MDGEILAKLERIAHRLPCWPGTLQLGRVDSPQGIVYLACGRGYSTEASFGQISWHGLWASHYGGAKGIGRTGEFSGSLDLRQARQHLLDDALWMLGMMADRDMHDPSYRLSNNG